MIPVNLINIAAGFAMACGGAMLLYQVLGLLADLPAVPPPRSTLRPPERPARPMRRRRRQALDEAVTRPMPAVELRAAFRS